MIGELERKVFSEVLRELKVRAPELWEDGTTGGDMVILAEELLESPESIMKKLEEIISSVSQETGDALRKINTESIIAISNGNLGRYSFSIILEEDASTSKFDVDGIDIIGNTLYIL